MKVLISVQPSTVNIPPREQLVQLMRGTADVLRNQLNSGQVDCIYATGQNEGFGIAEVGSIEQAWELVAQAPFAPFWDIKMTALADAIALTGIQIRQIEAMQRGPTPV